MPIINAVIFDLDNTLYDENSYLYFVCKEFCNRYNINTTLISYILENDLRIKSNDIFSDWLKKINFYSSDKQKELFEIYQTIKAPISLYKDAIKIIKFIKDKNIKIGILTNGVIQAQKNKVSLLNLDSEIIISYARDCGKEYEKPHPYAFKKILKLLNIKNNESIFVGDNPKTDIAGANNAGIFSVLLKRGYASKINNIKCDMIITNLNEIKKIWEKNEKNSCSYWH